MTMMEILQIFSFAKGKKKTFLLPKIFEKKKLTEEIILDTSEKSNEMDNLESTNPSANKIGRFGTSVL